MCHSQCPIIKRLAREIVEAIEPEHPIACQDYTEYRRQVDVMERILTRLLCHEILKLRVQGLG